MKHCIKIISWKKTESEYKIGSVTHVLGKVKKLEIISHQKQWKHEEMRFEQIFRTKLLALVTIIH